MTLLGLPAKNPPFNLPDFPVVRLAGLTLAEAHLEHPKEADHSNEGVVPLRKAALNFLPEAVLKRDALGMSPASVIDHIWLGGLCQVRSIQVAGVFPG